MISYMGIDPGADGALAVVSSEIGGPLDVSFMRFKGLTETDICDGIRSFGQKVRFTLLERVHSFPGMGVSGCFKFGMGFGLLKGALIANQLPFELIQPQAWQKHMKCLSKGDKNVTKALAQRLFPSVKVTHGNADAILIAECCRRTAVDYALRGSKSEV